MFNLNPDVQMLAVGNSHLCIVIDDALLEPERLPAYAQAYREDFQPAPAAAFPGLQLRMPEAFTQLLHEVFREHARRELGARRVLFSASQLALATQPAATLAPPHWNPRHLRPQAPEQCIAVAELFLFHDPTLGGTHFFLPRASTSQLEQLAHDADALATDEFAHKYAMSAGYPQASNAYFNLALTVPAKWNRLLIHDGAAFSSPAIADPGRLAADPRTGRLTLRATLTCSRPRVAW